MEPYRLTFSIEDIHLDCFGRLKPSTLLYFAQEAAGQHCKLLGLDWLTLQQRQLFWAIIRQKVEILRLPTAGQTITVETWPLPTTRTAFPRAMVAYDETGKVLFRLMSLWVLMDTQSRAMILPGKSGVEVPGLLTGSELTPPGSIAPKVMEHCQFRTVGYMELDQNLHMNNARYLDWVDDLLPSAFHREHPARGFTICYLSEAREGQTLQLHWQLQEDGILQVEGQRAPESADKKAERVFAVTMEF